ncbi:MAG: hypothetical protein NVV73_02615 [Cellvibrionaceae bacterium]|nr:hypothetical protein [Cellvibrionaceae bacterium]
MLAEKSHKTVTTFVVAATAAAIVLYSEQAMTANFGGKNDEKKVCEEQQGMEFIVHLATDRSSVQIFI